MEIEIIFSDERFSLIKAVGTNSNDELVERLYIKSELLDYGIEIGLIGGNKNRYYKQGDIIKIVYRNIQIYGTLNYAKNLNDAKEFVTIVQGAIEFAERVKSYLIENNLYDETA